MVNSGGSVNLGSASENEAKYKAGWKGGGGFDGPVPFPVRPIVSGRSENTKNMREEKSVPSIPVVLGRGSK